jgi:trehalose 6-phosphate phosphatase
VKPILRQWEEVQRVIQRPEQALWLFDFDGTLVPIARYPHEVVLAPETRHLLKKIAQRYPGRAGIVSGRAAKEIQRRVAIKELIYGGDHGYEIQGPRLRWHYPLSPSRRKQFRELARWIKREIPPIPGLWIEDKHWTLCIHYRTVNPKQVVRIKSILRRICNRVPAMGFIVQKGLKTIEILPDVNWNKGQAVRWLKKRLRAKSVFYVGDDTTDETVFCALGKSDISARIGRSRHSCAGYFLDQQHVSPELLQRIISL